MPTPKRSISSRVAKQNPRPRKYATAAERQKALRERFPTLCVRVEQEQADFMKRIADEQGRTLQDVHLAFIKYANGRGNQWLTQGLKGFAPLPRFEEPPKENPMKRKPTPAQIAARERFAAMARSGAFKKKAKRNPRASNPSARDSRTEVHLGGRYYGFIGKNSGLGHYTDIVYRDPRDFEGDKVVPDFNGRYYQSMNAALRALERYKKKMILENPRASNPIILVSDKAIASKRKANPTKRANPMIKYALVPDDGGFTFGMDDRTPVQFVFSNRDRVRGIYRSFALPKSVTSSLEFQQWASSLPGQSIIVSLNDLRKMLKRYA